MSNILPFPKTPSNEAEKSLARAFLNAMRQQERALMAMDSAMEEFCAYLQARSLKN